MIMPEWNYKMPAETMIELYRASGGHVADLIRDLDEKWLRELGIAGDLKIKVRD